MCIAAWAWRAHPLYPLILFFNRDEYLNRPTEAVSWWEEPEILGGKDGIGGGTWLACSKDGRFAFLTNVLEVDQLPLAKTRGQLPVRFLQSENSPLEFAEEVAEEALQYKGFNLVLVDLHTETMVYVTNRPSGEAVTIKKVSPGLHVLSNASLDTLWPKANRLRKNFKKLLRQYGKEEIHQIKFLDQLMLDTTRADRENLPNTGCDSDWELGLSSIFVDTQTKQGRLCTRSMIALCVKANSEVNLYERYLEEGIWKEHSTFYFINST